MVCLLDLGGFRRVVVARRVVDARPSGNSSSERRRVTDTTFRWNAHRLVFHRGPFRHTEWNLVDTLVCRFRLCSIVDAHGGFSDLAQGHEE